ncbi:helix-turn-helix transcriptional regulator [Nonomuraea sp. NPDC026600]|uniref:helix-turn-helix domain-containing protein n=1 Tax=Nonomuraea sp. NPDC026600 TaxID=3155363 RepID=UPI0033CFACA5
MAAELKRLRKESGLTAEQVAQQLEVAQSSVSRIESGRRGIKASDLRLLLDIYGVDGEKVEELLTLARQSRQRGWWHTYGDVVPEWFQVLIGLEVEAEGRRSYDVELIPGLLQTVDYYRAYLATQPTSFGNDEIDRKIAFRMARQERILQDDARKLSFVLNEASLRRVAAASMGPQGQFKRLTELSQLPHVTLQVLPFSAAMHAGMGGGFVLLSFTPPDPDVVYIENEVSGLYLEEQVEVDRYNLVYDCLMAKALSPGQSRSFIAKLGKEA